MFVFYSCAPTVFNKFNSSKCKSKPLLDAADSGLKKKKSSDLRSSLALLEKTFPKQKFQYGKLEYSVAEVILSMELLQKIIETSDSKKTFINQLKKKFLWWKSPGRKQDYKVLFTGYFEPQYSAALSLLKNIQYLLIVPKI